jgi:BirA family biotin operon repressor/biotin-[acetyl-CoA-carboxylase] ligase
MMEQRILAVFAERPGEYISGEQLSGMLGVSRTAVWKQIRKLMNEGYTFEAVPRRGYKLTGEPDRLSVPAMLAELDTKTMGRSIRLFDEIGSTQTIAHQLAREGAPEGTLIVAERQTEGRGRMGRSWHSPKGKGLWMSLLLRPRIPVQFTSQLTLLTAVAVCRAIRKLANVEAGIKWPNDLLIGGKKVCGILLESSAEDERLLYVVAGIGISVNLDPGDYPEALRDKAISLKMAAGKEISRTKLLRTVLKQFEELYFLYQAEGFAPIKTAWEALAVSLGKPVRTHSVSGIAESIDDSGALAVRTEDGKIVKLYSAEI